jgi:hypothetical protein
MTQSLLGRSAECDRLDMLVRDVGAGKGQALSLRGEPGLGRLASAGSSGALAS